MLSTDTVHWLHGILRAVLRRAQAHDHVKRNVALLVDPPRGTAGRPSRALTADQATRLLTAAEADDAMRAYVVVSLITRARTEELRALTWTHVDLDGKPPTVALWRSVRAGGETKTRQSRAPSSCRRWRPRPSRCTGQVSCTPSWRRGSGGRKRTWCSARPWALHWTRRTSAARFVGWPQPPAWTRRRGRHASSGHSFVSLLSSTGMTIEDISHLVGHASSRVTEVVPRSCDRC
jgi:integrase